MAEQPGTESDFDMTRIQTGARGEELRILAVRADRLGDVILSTPAFEVIKRHYPHSRLSILVQEAVVPVLRGLACVDEILVYDPQGRHAGLKGLWRLSRELTHHRFRIAVVLQSQWKIAAALFLARVRYRVGPLSKLHSFFFYNRGVRQARSQVEMHEADYNLQLLRRLGIRVGARNVPPRVHVAPESVERARRWLLEQGWDGQAPLVVVHPGMGGSALNWPDTHYQEFIRAMLNDGRKILVTAGPTESSILERVKAGLGPLAGKAIFYGGPSAGGLDLLAGMLRHASLVVAPSTGPLHLAVALGRRVITFYPPIRVQSAIRWGPYVSDPESATVNVPEVYCGEDFSCRGNLCNYFPCMKGITVTQALEQASKHLSGAP